MKKVFIFALIKKRTVFIRGCDVIGSHARLRIWCCEAWGFESLHPHHFLEIFVAFTSTFLKNIIAKIAQLVEHDLAKVGVAGSNPVFRSTFALVVELVDTQDLKSCVRKDVRVQVPSEVL